MTAYPPLHEVMPHRAPMILLDRIETASEESIACRVKIRSDSPFVEEGVVPAVVAAEYMAQCVAAYAGLEAFLRGGEIRIGYLIGARLIELSVDGFLVGEELLVKAHRVWGDHVLGSFECSVESGGRGAASAVLTVFQGDIDGMEAGSVAGP